MSFVYIRTEARLWVTGFYRPDGTWEPESDCDSKDEAAQRAAWLNGGGHADMLETRISLLEDWMHDHEQSVPHAEVKA